MPKVSEIKIEIGRDGYGRCLTATRYISSSGKRLWKLEAEPVSQRDEGERMWSLTDDNLRDLSKVVTLGKEPSNG